MKTINFPNKNGYSTKPKVFALGKFESMHLGHKKIFNKARELANKLNFEFGIMMFNENPENNIYSLTERIEFTKKYNPDYIMIFEKNRKNFSITKSEFNSFLKKINVKEVVLGKDFRYGKSREGDINSFGEINRKIIDYVNFKDKRISTTRIKACVEKFDFISYKLMTNRYFSYRGIVENGLGNGKMLGTPTANITYPLKKLDINDGIYFSYLTFNNKKYPSLTSISYNPTLNSTTKTYETFIYDFDKEIYGDEVKVEIIEKMREPIKFDTLEELANQMEDDKLKGKAYFDIKKV